MNIAQQNVSSSPKITFFVVLRCYHPRPPDDGPDEDGKMNECLLAFFSSLVISFIGRLKRPDTKMASSEMTAKLIDA